MYNKSHLCTDLIVRVPAQDKENILYLHLFESFYFIILDMDKLLTLESSLWSMSGVSPASQLIS